MQIGRSDLAPISTAYDRVTPDIIRQELQKCRPNSIPIIIIDEFDKLRDDSAKELSANVLKALYDYTANVTIILVGVAENVGELVSDHQSLRRTLSPIKLERMRKFELNEIIDKRIGVTPMELSAHARETIVSLSLGLPYYVQILGKFACQKAVVRHSTIVHRSDVRAAMDKLITESGESFFEEYRIATESNQVDNFFREVLLSCALAQTDQSGFFTATQVLEPLNHIVREVKKHAHIQRHLSEFISERRGEILIRRGIPRQYRYRFADPLIQPYIIIKGIRDKMLNEDIITRPYSSQPRLPNV
jgi:Cdc6-like AAA superfamily ATPase